MLKRILHFPYVVLKGIPSMPKKIFRFLKEWVYQVIVFSLYLFFYLFTKIIVRIARLRIMPKRLIILVSPPFIAFYNKILVRSGALNGTISRFNLIDLSLKNMSMRKSRSYLTIGGVSVGIGAIVFLVSIGYGLQNLVISRVARLEEMRQIDVSTQPGSQTVITDETISVVEGLGEVSQVLPLISVVGKISFNNSESDMAVFGVTTDYLTQSAIVPSQGQIYDNNDISKVVISPEARLGISENIDEAGSLTEEVLGIYSNIEIANLGQIVRNVTYSIYPEEFVRVRKSPDKTSEMIGYAKRTEGASVGTEVLGSGYTDNDNGNVASDLNGNPLGIWIEDTVLVWEKDEDMYLPLLDDNGDQVQSRGYFAAINVFMGNDIPKIQGQVLADVDEIDDIDETETVASSDIDVNVTSSETVEDVSEEDEIDLLISELVETSEVVEKTVYLHESATRVAVVNRAAINVLGINEDEAVGKTFDVSFILPGVLLDEDAVKVQSEFSTYTIVAVVPDDRSPYFYVPFTDLRGLGISKYSQLKVVIKNEDAMSDARTKIEALGYQTSSVADTVAQIDLLFNTARQVLALVGMVALAVASLGMFNTLTVSLLERTREVGLMKAMGMKSNEVKDLFLTESMIMGFFGGMGGLVLGFVSGKLLSVALSIYSVSRGAGIVDITYIPAIFVSIILGLSLIVGVLTGIYPARRAKNISALNALRYE